MAAQQKYLIVTGTLTSLADSVNKYIAQGYSPLGSPFPHSHTPSFCQALYYGTSGSGSSDGTNTLPPTLIIPSDWLLRGDWLPNTAYAVGDVVIENNTPYLIMTAYTSGSVFSKTNMWQISGELINEKITSSS